MVKKKIDACLDSLAEIFDPLHEISNDDSCPVELRHLAKSFHEFASEFFDRLDTHQLDSIFGEADETDECDRRREVVSNSDFCRWAMEQKGVDWDCAYFLAIDPYPSAVALREEYRRSQRLSQKGRVAQ